MAAKKFSALNVNKLSNHNAYTLYNSTMVAAQTYQSALSQTSRVALTNFQTNVQSLAEKVAAPRSSIYTPQIDEKDAERDLCFNEIVKTIKVAVKSIDSNKKSAATYINNFFAPYYSIAGAPLNTQTGMIARLISEYYADQSLQQYAATLGIADLLNRLSSINTELDTLYKTRLTQTTKKTQESNATALKLAADKSYSTFCSLVEQECSLTPSEGLEALFTDMNGFRKKYHALIESGKSDEPTNPGSGESSEGDTPAS